MVPVVESQDMLLVIKKKKQHVHIFVIEQQKECSKYLVLGPGVRKTF